MTLRTEWLDARRDYEATTSGLAARMATIALDDFERLCGPHSLTDAAAVVDGFVEALSRDGVDPTSIEIYRETVEGVVSWAMSQQRAAA